MCFSFYKLHCPSVGFWAVVIQMVPCIALWRFLGVADVASFVCCAKVLASTTRVLDLHDVFLALFDGIQIIGFTEINSASGQPQRVDKAQRIATDIAVNDWP